jgi:hypothetical protein
MIGMADHWNYATAFRESLPYRILKNLLNGLGAAARSRIDRHDLHIGTVFFFTLYRTPKCGGSENWGLIPGKRRVFSLHHLMQTNPEDTRKSFPGGKTAGE